MRPTILLFPFSTNSYFNLSRESFRKVIRFNLLHQETHFYYLSVLYKNSVGETLNVNPLRSFLINLLLGCWSKNYTTTIRTQSLQSPHHRTVHQDPLSYLSQNLYNKNYKNTSEVHLSSFFFSFSTVNYLVRHTIQASTSNTVLK